MSKEKTKGRPMVVWCVVSWRDVVSITLHNQKPAKFIASEWNKSQDVGHPFRVVRFVESPQRKGK